MNRVFTLGFCLIFTGCSYQNGPSSYSGPITDASIPTSGVNVMQLQVGNCGPNQYVNEPCVSVTICAPGTSNCQTIPNILLDTGSFGLRIFSSQIQVPLVPITSAAGNAIAECVTYADHSSQWGPVRRADITLASETAFGVPIEVIDASFGTRSSNCQSADASPESAGFNGILGVGLFAQDCGAGCVTEPRNNLYFECSNGSCSGTTVDLINQVTNPVALLAQDNNGVVIELPALPSTGGGSAIGAVLLGIGTRSNNSPGNVGVIKANASGNMVTQFNGQSLANSFIDSGSNGFYLPPTSQLTACSSQTDGFYCPDSILNLSAVQISKTTSTQITVPFQVLSADAIFYSGLFAFNNLAGDIPGYFDWGLPFFFGRSVYVGIQNRTSSLGTGPYWAF